MSISNQNQVALAWQPASRRGAVVLRLSDHDGRPLFVDELNVLKEQARERFVQRLLEKWPELNAEEVRQRLLQIAAEVARQAARDSEDDADSSDDVEELDPSQMISADLFFTPEVAGIAVPVVAVERDKVQTQWQWHLRWGDGRREIQPVAPWLTLPDGQRLWTRRLPRLLDGGTESPRWGAAARQRWLESGDVCRPKHLFYRLVRQFRRFVKWPGDKSARRASLSLLAAWTLLTYVFPAFGRVPYLHIVGPVGSGKTRLLELLQRLVFSPIQSSSITSAAVFRTLDDRYCTLLLDEVDAQLAAGNQTSELAAILQSGYRHGGDVLRVDSVGDQIRPRAFPTFGPKALAGIDSLPAALASRCVPVRLMRAEPGSPVTRRRLDADEPRWAELRDALHATALEHATDWLAAADRFDIVPRELPARAAEIWQPLLALAAWWVEHGVAPSVLESLQAYALQTAAEGAELGIPEEDFVLLRLLARHWGSRLTPSELLAVAREEEPALFGDFSANRVARRLVNYGLRTTKRGSRREYRVNLMQLREVELRFGLDLDLPDVARAQSAAA